MARARLQSGVDTRTRILDVAEALAQRRGFNGFSYADIASKVGITTASLHYHFPSKAVLGRELIKRYAEGFADELIAIGARYRGVPARLEAYANLYAAVLKEGRFCLCGMLAAEYETLPKPMRAAVIDFFDQNEAWLAHELELGRDHGELSFAGSPADQARVIVCSLEGAMLIARPYGEVSRFQNAAVHLLMGLRSNAKSKPAAETAAALS